MCLTIKLSVFRPLASALASAFLRRPIRNSADLTGCLALETPKALPVNHFVSILRAMMLVLFCDSRSVHVPEPPNCCSCVPCAVRPVLPAYLLIGIASFNSCTFSRYFRARSNFQPLIACAVSRVFLNETRRYEPRLFADLADGILSWGPYRT